MSLKPYPQYKNSDVSWIGNIPNDWIILRNKYFLSELNIHSITGDEELLTVSQYTGITKRKDRLKEETDLLTTVSTLEGYKIVEKEAMVMNIMLAWNGSLGVSEFHGIVSPAYCVFRINKNLVFPKYLHYLHRTKLYTGIFETASTGVIKSRLRLYPDNYLALTSALPSPEEQHQIARYLDWKTSQISKFIKAKKRLIELLKEQKQVIINDAVTGKIDVHTGKPYPKYKNSGVEWLGMVPEEWEVFPMKQLATFNPSKGETGFNSDSIEPVVFLPMEKVSNDGVVDCSLKLPFKEISKGFSYFKKDDVVIAKITPCFENGKGAFLENLETEFGFGTTEFITIRPRQFINGRYLRFILSSNWFLKIGEMHMTGSAGQKRVSTDFIKNFVIGLPSISDQVFIIAKLNETLGYIEEAINKTKKEIDFLQEYRTRLIADVVTGKVDVRDVEVPEIVSANDANVEEEFVEETDEQFVNE